MKEKETNKRPYISVYWKCCHTFSRVYKDPSGKCYKGYCPRCRSPLEAPVGPGGTNQRTFTTT